ncbi:hypothetical protein J4Q44_G00204540 [Coregonus suidteri]|uniref:Uncharacterized protein n=1 Tax=Coregonus suidteri TaxID=861788 RepID=A0AAN8QRR4_9TELE
MSFITGWRRSVKKNDKGDTMQAEEISADPNGSPTLLSVINSPELDSIHTDFKLQLPDNKDSLNSTEPLNTSQKSDLSVALEDCMAALDLFLRNDFEEALSRLRCSVMFLSSLSPCGFSAERRGRASSTSQLTPRDKETADRCTVSPGPTTAQLSLPCPSRLKNAF